MVHAQHPGQPAAQPADFMAHSHKFCLGILALDRSTDGRHRVGIVENPSIGTDFHGILDDFQDYLADAKRMENSSRPAVLPVYLVHAVLKGNLPILIPHLETIAHLDGGYYEISADECTPSIGGCRHRIAQAVRLDEILRCLQHNIQSFCIDVEQCYLASCECFAGEDVSQRTQAKLDASSTNQNNFHRLSPSI